jgi:hypothetical protein
MASLLANCGMTNHLNHGAASFLANHGTNHGTASLSANHVAYRGVNLDVNQTVTPLHPPLYHSSHASGNTTDEIYIDDNDNDFTMHRPRLAVSHGMSPGTAATHVGAAQLCAYKNTWSVLPDASHSTKKRCQCEATFADTLCEEKELRLHLSICKQSAGLKELCLLNLSRRTFWICLFTWKRRRLMSR